MTKRIALFVFVTSLSLLSHAQWTGKDSINLKRLLEGDGEIKLNQEAIKQVQQALGSPLIIRESSATKYDESLPKVYPEKEKLVLTLMPYTARTKYNYDPIYKKKIDLKADTYKSNPFETLYALSIPTNWAKHPFEGGYRKSLEEIEATGLKYNPLAERANNKAVGAWKSAAGPTGYDFMTPFTKDFWNIKGNKRKARTREVLASYGDSTSVLIDEPILRQKIK